VSAPPGRVDPERWARLLAAAEVARRGGTAREVRRGSAVLLAVAVPGGDEVEVRVAGLTTGGRLPAPDSALRLVVDAEPAEPVFYVVAAGADAAAGMLPWRGRWELLGL
jgi:hypothetical protein